MIIMLLGMLGLMFFMQSRAKKQAATQQQFRASLQPGQRVMTQGGLVGTIVSINDAEDTIVLESAGSLCEYKRAGIAKLLDAPEGGIVGTPVAPRLPLRTSATPVVKSETTEVVESAVPVAGAAYVVADNSEVADWMKEYTDSSDVLDSLSQEYHNSQN